MCVDESMNAKVTLQIALGNLKAQLLSVQIPSSDAKNKSFLTKEYAIL